MTRIGVMIARKQYSRALEAYREEYERSPTDEVAQKIEWLEKKCKGVLDLRPYGCSVYGLPVPKSEEKRSEPMPKKAKKATKKSKGAVCFECFDAGHFSLKYVNNRLRGRETTQCSVNTYRSAWNKANGIVSKRGRPVGSKNAPKPDAEASE